MPRRSGVFSDSNRCPQPWAGWVSALNDRETRMHPPVAPLPHPSEASAGGHHFSDDLHAAIENGPVPVKEGTDPFRRRRAMAADDKESLGFTESAQELESVPMNENIIAPHRLAGRAMRRG